MVTVIPDWLFVILIVYLVFSIFIVFSFFLQWDRDRTKEREKEIKSKILHEIFENNIITSGRFEYIESRIKKLEDDKK